MSKVAPDKIDWLKHYASATALLLILIITSLPLFVGNVEFNGDDIYFIINNSHITGFNLADILLTPQKEYTPVTLLSFALEYALWGPNAKLFHATNILLFISLGVAAFCLSRRLVGDLTYVSEHWRMPLLLLASAILFFHPLNVESIASISSRKELLYVLFGLLSLLAYTSPCRSAKMFAAALCCQTLAQLSKGSAVVLPLMFLAWELGEALENSQKIPPNLPHRWFRLTVPLLLAVCIFIFQLKIAARVGLVSNMPDLNLLDRTGAIVRTFHTMLAKLLFPMGMSFEYDIPWSDGLPPFDEWLLPATVMVAIGALIYRRQWRIMVLLLLPLLTLLPYLNIIPLKHNLKGQLVFYDHYMLFFLVASVPLLATVLSKASGKWQQPALLLCLTLIIGYSAYNFRLYGYWKNQESLYSRNIQLSPELPRSYMFMGRFYFDAERYEEAKPYFDRIEKTKNWFPAFADAIRYQGDCLAFTGSYPEAEERYRQYLKFIPNDTKALQNLSTALIYQGKLSEARMVILDWLSIAPDDPSAHTNMEIIRKSGL